jgi:ATP-dependent DNA helicase DinG
MNIPFIPYLPVDQSPVPPQVLDRLRFAYKIITFSKFGQTELQKSGFSSTMFWEGVDVKGDALSLVVIDKLPFFSPEDPVLAARIDKINQSGKNAFMEYQLPNAVITLKQGAGRLIRDEFDKGVLVICDTRVIDKAYGKRMWQSLPPFARTRDDLEVIQFLEKI